MSFPPFCDDSNIVILLFGYTAKVVTDLLAYARKSRKREREREPPGPLYFRRASYRRAAHCVHARKRDSVFLFSSPSNLLPTTMDQIITNNCGLSSLKLYHTAIIIHVWFFFMFYSPYLSLSFSLALYVHPHIVFAVIARILTIPSLPQTQTLG